MASISRMANGKWRARYRPIPTANQKSRIFDTRRDAQRWLDEVTASMVTGQYVDPLAGKITFAAFYEQWSARKAWAPGTTLAMNLAAESVTFGRVRMSSLRASHVESWVKSMIDRGLAPGTIKTRFNNVRAVLRAAVRDRMIPSDPAIGVDLPRTRRAESSMQLPTVEQVGALLGCADDNFKAFIGLCAFAGLRLGEAAALQVGDIDFLRTKSLRVTRQVRRAVAGQVDIRSPKYGSERTVYVPDDLLALLAQHIATYRPGTDPSRVDVRRQLWRSAAPEHRRLLVATGEGRGRCRRRAIARPAALLRVRPHRRRLRRRHRSAGAGPLEGEHHPRHVLASVADR